MKRGVPSDGFLEAVIEGLGSRPRGIPCRYLYDAVGSALFERVTELPGYYLTQAEADLLRRHGRTIAGMVGPDARLVEFGAGSMRKTRLLIAALAPSAFVPVDVADMALLHSARRLSAEFPDLPVEPLVADFTRLRALPPLRGKGPVVVYFAGSTIGNLRPAEARDLLVRVSRLVGRGGWMLVGVDPVRDPDRLHAAYDDPQGVTSAFIRNILARANRELGADFDLDSYDHSAWWNGREGRVEISLVANRRQRVTVAGHSFAFRSGDSIHIEDCYKYAVDQFHWLARQGGFVPAGTWTSDGFSLHLLRAVAFG